MFHLRRAALRALSQQGNALPRSSKPLSSRVSTLSRPSSKSIAWRGFHQARIWRAEEEQKGNIAKESGASPAEDANTAATVTAERSAAEQQAEITEKSIATPGAADAAPRESTTEAITEKAADIAAETAEKAEEVAAETTENFSQAARSGADAIEEAADAAPQESAAEAITEKAEEVAAETTQNFSQAARTGAEAAAAASTSPPRRPQHDTRSTHRNPRPSRIVYVGNLFFEVTAQQLQAEFASHGSVINSRIVTDSRGLSKGFGYIEFAEQEAADAAVRALDQKVLQGRRMAVQYHVQRQPGAKRDGMQRGRNQSSAEPSKTLFIGNMSYQMSDRDLNDLFREIRDVLDVRVAIDRRSGQPRGFAHADFIDVPSAQRAKEHLEKKVVYGRQLRVDYSGSANNNRDSMR